MGRSSCEFSIENISFYSVILPRQSAIANHRSPLQLFLKKLRTKILRKTGESWELNICGCFLSALDRVYKIVFRLSSTLWREEYRQPESPQYLALAKTVQNAVSIYDPNWCQALAHNWCTVRFKINILRLVAMPNVFTLTLIVLKVFSRVIGSTHNILLHF